MFNWDDGREPTQDDLDAAEAFADIIEICKPFSRHAANCHNFMTASDTLMKKYLQFQRGNRVKAQEYINANHTIVTRHLGARGDATHADICMFAPEHGGGGGTGGRGDRPRRRG